LALDVLALTGSRRAYYLPLEVDRIELYQDGSARLAGDSAQQAFIMNRHGARSSCAKSEGMFKKD